VPRSSAAPRRSLSLPHQSAGCLLFPPPPSLSLEFWRQKVALSATSRWGEPGCWVAPGATGPGAPRCTDELEPPFEALAAVAARQHGLITSHQLGTAGLTRSAIGRWERAGRLRRLVRGLYTVPPYPDSWEQRAHAAVLAGPPGTVVSHRAAAALHEMRGFRPAQIEVLGHRWHRSHELPDVVVHESLVVDPVDVARVQGIAVTSPVRTIIDLGAVAHPNRIGQALDEARRRGHVDLADVKQRLEELAVQGRNGIAVVRELVDIRQGRLLTSTGFEDLFRSIVDEFRLPAPRHQWTVVHGAFTARLDFAYPEHMVAIEADSEEYHLDLETFHRDRSRQNTLSLLGWTILRYTARHLRHHRGLVARQVTAALTC